MDSTPVSWPSFNLWVDLASLAGSRVFLLGHSFVLSLDTLQVFQGRLSPQSSVGTFSFNFRVGRTSEIICSHPRCTEEEKGLDWGHTVGQGQSPDPALLAAASLLSCHSSLHTSQIFLILAFLPLFYLYLT